MTSVKRQMAHRRNKLKVAKAKHEVRTTKPTPDQIQMIVNLATELGYDLKANPRAIPFPTTFQQAAEQIASLLKRRRDREDLLRGVGGRPSNPTKTMRA